MAGCLVVTLPLELVLGARVYRRGGVLLLALLPVVVAFSIWDVVGILRGHWTYNDRFVSGLRLVFGMPVEELVFFLVVPICGLLTYETVGVMLRRLRSRTGPDDEGGPPGGRSSRAVSPIHRSGPPRA